MRARAAASPWTPTAAMRAAASAGLLALLLGPGPGPALAGELHLAADRERVTVGDPVTIEVRASLGQGAAVVDPVPRPRDPLPEGVRILAAGGLRRAEGGTLTGRLRVAFFRPGPQEVPPLALAYRPSPGAPAETLLSRPLPVEVVPVLPPGDQALRDIKPLEPLPGRSPLLLWAALAAGGASAACALGHLRRRRQRAAPAGPPPPSGRTDPYDAALARLAAVEEAGWPTRGEVDRHYELVADALRRYLVEAHGVLALAHTTAELIPVLPPVLSGGGLGETCRRLLAEADLVKFAGSRPDPATAAAFLARTRALLERWHAASGVARAERAADRSSADALR